jgi:hypothetical protein
MRAMEMRWTGMTGTFALAMLLVTGAGAQCLSGPVTKSPQNNNQQTTGGTRLIRSAYRPASNDGFGQPVVVGMWHVKMVAETVSEGVPFSPGTEFDAGFQQWHSDGTEMLNSGGRPPATGSFCMGVWEQTGPRTFKLNHFAISWSDATTRQGPTSIVEEVTVSEDGKSFTGHFTLTDYAETDSSTGNSIAVRDTITGTVTGTRVEVNTPPTPIF